MRTTKRLALLLLAALFACPDSNIVVGGGPDVVEESATRQRTYQRNFEKFINRHRKLLEVLFHMSPAEPNLVLAASYATDCVQALEGMQNILQEPEASGLGLYLGNYRNLDADLHRNQIPALEFELENWNREVRSQFDPRRVNLIQPTAPGQTVQPTAKPGIPGSPPQFDFDKWQEKQSELELHWIRGESCKSDFDAIVNTLETFLKLGPNEKTSMYLQHYRSLCEVTKEFQAPPPGDTRQRILQEIMELGLRIRQNLKPVKKE